MSYRDVQRFLLALDIRADLTEVRALRTDYRVAIAMYGDAEPEASRVTSVKRA